MRQSALRESEGRLGVRLLGKGEHLVVLYPEHRGGVLSRYEDAATDIEVPDGAVLGLVSVSQSLQRPMVGHSNCRTLDDNVDTTSPGIAPRGDRDLPIAFQVAGLLFPQPCAEMHSPVLPNPDQRGYMRPAISPNRGQPIQFGLLEYAHHVRPRRGLGLRVTEPAVELAGRLGTDHG